MAAGREVDEGHAAGHLLLRERADEVCARRGARLRGRRWRGGGVGREREGLDVLGEKALVRVHARTLEWRTREMNVEDRKRSCCCATVPKAHREKAIYYGHRRRAGEDAGLRPGHAM